MPHGSGGFPQTLRRPPRLPNIPGRTNPVRTDPIRFEADRIGVPAYEGSASWPSDDASPLPKRPRITLPPRFTIGDVVRVRPGIADPDFPDIPLGGWAGFVEEINRRGPVLTYLIAWNDRTLEQMHPVFRNRCTRDDLDADSMWLAESDLELDAGEPATIEQPTQIVTRPLNQSNRQDRIRTVFHVTSDDPVPTVSREALRR